MIVKVSKDKFALLRKLFTPHGAHCYGCGVATAGETKGETPFLCKHCMERIEPLSFRLCKRCGAPMPMMHDSELCGDCNFKEVNIDFMRGAVLWNEFSKFLVYMLKSDVAREVSATMVWFMKREVESMNIDFDVITPVPTYRPYNKNGHATFLAMELARQLNKPLSRGSLVKIQSSVGYSENGFDGREKQAVKNFRVVDNRDFKGKKVLLVDDVITTGNTLNACAGLLKKADAIAVVGIGFARVAYRLKEIRREATLQKTY